MSGDEESVSKRARKNYPGEVSFGALSKDENEHSVAQVSRCTDTGNCTWTEDGTKPQLLGGLGEEGGGGSSLQQMVEEEFGELSFLLGEPQVGMFTPRATGDTVLDIFIATAVPMLVQGLACEWSKVKPRIWTLLKRAICWVHTDRYFRTISFEKMISTFRDDNNISDGSHRNNILQRAVLLYVGQLGVRYPEAEVMLAAVKEKGTMEGQQQDYLGRPRVVYGSTAEQLKAYQINITPPWNHWVYIGDDIRFRAVREVKEECRSGTAVKKTTTFMFSCEKPDGDMRIQAFVDRAFQWYCTAIKSTEDNSRYLYNLLTENRDTVSIKARAGQNNDPGMAWMMGADRERMRIMSSGSKPHRYQRYKLGDVKGFDSLFFPEKAKLLEILQNFENKTGKYAINGYPHKLGLLLHGPPGTGKTSLIKALALHTKRHIVSVPLARITTNQDLMDIMYDQTFWVVKEELPVTLPFESMIFVMEDIDAQSPIVRCRSHPLGKRRTRRQFDQQQQQQQPQKLVIAKAQGVTPASSTTNSTSDGPRSPFLFSQCQKDHLVPAQKSDNHDSTTVTVTAGAEGARVDSSLDPLVDRFPCLSDPMISVSSEISDSSLSSSMTKLTAKPATTVPSIECTEASKAVVSDETPLVASEASKAVISGCRDETAPAQGTKGIESQSEGRLEGELGLGSGAAEVRGLLGATEDQEQILTVKSRDDTRARGREAAVHVAAASLGSVKLDGGDDEYLESSNSDMFEEEEVARTAQGEGIGVGERMMASALVELAGKGSDQRANMKEYARWTDKLDLAGLLNALDGVVDSPGRIVIITTNHPEMLDPALIRPGRIDKNVYLDYMRYPAAVEMTRHFFQVEDLTASEHERLRAVFEGGAVSSSFDEGIQSSPRRITPATVEQLAGEHDNVGDFIEALEALC